MIEDGCHSFGNNDLNGNALESQKFIINNISFHP